MELSGLPAHNNNMLILPTAYCAPVEYFALIAQNQAHEVFVEQMETYPKQTWRNRCTILTSQGLLNLSIPVQKPQGNHTLTHQVEIMNESKWYVNHWRAITSAYNASPFFLFYQDELTRFFSGEHADLLEFNTLLTAHFLKLLNITAALIYTEQYVFSLETADYRSALSPKKAPVFQYFPSYTQVFSTEKPFEQNLSILDLLFNLGPEAGSYLKKIR